MATTSITPDLDAIVAEIEVGAPAERVFRALIDPKQLLRWWTSDVCPMQVWEFDARRGGKWRFETSNSGGKLVVNGVSEFKTEGEVLEYDPLKLLAYTWIANWHDKPSRKTQVRWELTPAGKGTRVKVTHSGLAEETVARKDYSGGWVGVLGSLKQHFEP
jgi:uncharacterized protein YndB with AHSA1/START domain